VGDPPGRRGDLQIAATERRPLPAWPVGRAGRGSRLVFPPRRRLPHASPDSSHNTLRHPCGRGSLAYRLGSARSPTTRLQGAERFVRPQRN